MVRSTITTQGKTVSFSVDLHYYLPLPNADKSTIFNGHFKDSKFCVAYTKVVHDCGYHDVMRWGTPSLEHYDNGNVGYQCFNYFNNEDDALEDYNARKKLTRKDFTKTIAYADVFLIENNN